MSTPPPEDNESFARGLAGVVAGRTAISSLDGDLRYRGFSIESLAVAADFEEVAFLLLYGELPTAEQLAAFTERLRAAATSIDPAVFDALTGLARQSPQASVMDALRTGVSMLGQFEGDDGPPLPLDAANRQRLISRAENLLGQVPALLAGWLDLLAARPVAAWPDRPLAAALLERLRGSVPTAAEAAAFAATLVLYAEHEFNASTFAARTVVSTGSDMHSGVTAAIGALKGPLHGGANEQVLHLLGEIGASERADAWLAEQLAARRVVMGFGHRVYKQGDVRAVLLSRICSDLIRQPGMAPEHRELERLADRLEVLMLERKGLRPNLDWPAARVYHALDLPVKIFTPIFVVARMSGWTAHIIEQLSDNRLIRPMSHYVGFPSRDYIPLHNR